jgi:hypothetical protein
MKYLCLIVSAITTTMADEVPTMKTELTIRRTARHVVSQVGCKSSLHFSSLKFDAQSQPQLDIGWTN